MKKLQWLSLAMALAACTALASPAMASAPASASQSAKEKTQKEITPANLYDLIAAKGEKLYNSMEEEYYDLSDDDTASILDSAAGDYLDIMEEALSNLYLLALADEDDSIPYNIYKYAPSMRWDNFTDGSAIAVSNTSNTVTVRYVYGGKIKEDLSNAKGMIKTSQQKEDELVNSPDLKVTGGEYYVQASYIRGQNRMSVSYGSKMDEWDLGCVDVVYRNDNSIYMQVTYPVKRMRSLPVEEPFWAGRIYLQENRFRMSQTFVDKSEVPSIRVNSPYVSWDSFAFEDSNTFDYNKNSFKLYDPQGKLLLDSKEGMPSAKDDKKSKD